MTIMKFEKFLNSSFIVYMRTGTIEINDQKFSYPKSSDEITYRELFDLIQILDNQKIGDYEKNIECVRILTGIYFLDEIQKEQFETILLPLFDYLTTEVKEIFDFEFKEKFFEFEGKKYVWKEYIGDCPLRQYATLEDVLQGESKKEKPNINSILPNLLAAYCLPEGTELLTKEIYAQNSFDFWRLPCKSVIGIANFISSRELDFKIASLRSLQVALILWLRILKLKQLKQNGSGNRWFTRWFLNSTLKRMKPIENQLQMYLSGSHTNEIDSKLKNHIESIMNNAIKQ